MKKRQLKNYIEAELENIQALILEIDLAIKEEKEDYLIADLAAIACFVHNFYNALENILKRILYYKDIELPSGSSWHKDLLKASEETKIISDQMHMAILEYLSFRHFFAHMYVFNLKWPQLKPLAYGVKPIFQQFKLEIAEYLKDKP